MRDLKVKLASPEEAKEIVSWLGDNPSFDPGILKYPTFRIITAYNGQNISHMPSQQVLMLESVAINPQSTELERAQALRYMLNGNMLLASSHGIKEIFFLASDEKVAKMAKDHGFEEVPWKALRLKL